MKTEVKILVGLFIALVVCVLYYLSFLVIQWGLAQFGYHITIMQGVAMLAILFIIRTFFK